MVATRPNILFILSDQQRWDTLGCYGQRRLVTPHLDALARDGVRFEHAFSCQPVCGPCRAALQSGLYPTQVGCPVNHRALPVDQPTLAKALDAVGYETAYVGKWHLASDDQHDHRTSAIPAERRGGYRTYWMAADVLEFTSSGYEGYYFNSANQRVDWEGYRVDRTTDFALEYLDQYAARRSDQPFFLFLSYIEPHHQNDLDRYIGPIGSKHRWADFDPPGDLIDAQGDWRAHYPDYLGCCHSLDANVARLRDALQRQRLWDNTLVIYTSDHGCHFRTRNREYKRSCHDSSIRVPLIMHGPGCAGNQVRPEVVSLIDLPATVLDIAGTALPQVHGRTLRPLLEGRSGPWQNEAFVQISESQCGRALRTERWTYSVYDPTLPPGWTLQTAAQRYQEQCLYDMAADPHQQQNLVSEPAYAPVRAELAQRLRARCLQHEGHQPEIIPASA